MKRDEGAKVSKLLPGSMEKPSKIVKFPILLIVIMEQEVINLKLEVEKLRRENYEKYSEIEKLSYTNSRLTKILKNQKITDTSEILFEPDTARSQSPFMNTLKSSKLGGTGLIAKTAEQLTKAASLARILEGEFEYRESSSSFISLDRWEFVIVCPNPDLGIGRSVINFVDAEKLFRKSFRPEFSPKLSVLRVNQQTELKAFTMVFESLPHTGTKIDEKKFSGGKRFIIDKAGMVIDNKGPARDFLTVMRNALLIKLSLHLGLHTKQIISSNGKYIYILVCADEADLENEAEAVNYNLQMEIGEIDLPSLEPCDEKLRPLRLLKPPPHKESIPRLLFELHTEFPDIMELFKTTESDGDSYDPEMVFDETWDTYISYLVEFQKALHAMKEFKLEKHNEKMCLQKILKQTINKVNSESLKDFKLKTLWDRMGFKEPMSPYFDFTRKIDPMTKQDNFRHIWKKYDSIDTNSKAIFRPIDRIKLLGSLITRQADLHYLAQKEIIVTSFPLKSHSELYGFSQFTNAMQDQDYIPETKKMLNSLYTTSQKGIINQWNNAHGCTTLPLSKVRNYFGEKIGMYFAFVSYFGKFLSVPSIIGLIIFVLQRLYSADSRIVIGANTFYCIYISIWATCFVEFWNRKESCLAIKWGQSDYEEDEVPRPQFHGEIRRSPVDDEMKDVYFPPTRRYKLFVLTGFITCVFIAAVITTVLGIIFLRWQLTNNLTFQNTDLSGPICSSLNAFQIQFFNIIFNKVAVKLNNLENHRTQSDYENSLIIKSYVFQFVNSFFSLFYIAFFKTRIEGCIVWEGNVKDRIKGASCMGELYTQFITIFTVSILKNIAELGVPYLKSKLKEKEFKKTAAEQSLYKARHAQTEIEIFRDQIDKQFQLEPYITKDVDGTLGDYLELSILYGYITLFAVGFPLSAILTFLAVVIELHVDKFKLLHLVRRPIPYGAKDISSWKTIFVFNSIASIVTNAAIICFTSSTFQNWQTGQDNVFLIFAIFCISLLFIRAMIAFGIPDVPYKYKIVFKRHSRIIQRFVKGWEVKKSRGGVNQVYVNPNIYCTFKAEAVTSNA